MSTDLQTTTQPPALWRKDASVSQVLSRFQIYEEGVDRFANRFPTVTEREILARRGQELDALLTPSGETMTTAQRRKPQESSAGRIIAALFTGYPSLRNANAEEMAAAYALHLKDLPIFAIQQACDAVRRCAVFDTDPKTGNKTPLDPDWPPSAPRLHMIANGFVDDVFKEKYHIDRILNVKKLDPPPVSEEQRERVGKMLKALGESLRVEDEIHNPQPTRDAQREREIQQRAILRDYAAAGVEPVVDGTGMVFSLPLMLSLGWKIAEIDGERKLVKREDAR